jgi:hypothetical protein
MSKINLTELKGWSEIIELAGRDNTPNQGQARAMASQKQAFAVANLSENVFTAQKHISQRLDLLNERLDESSNSAQRLARWTIGLTIALVIATIVQAVAAIIVATK